MYLCRLKTQFIDILLLQMCTMLFIVWQSIGNKMLLGIHKRISHMTLYLIGSKIKVRSCLLTISEVFSRDRTPWYSTLFLFWFLFIHVHTNVILFCFHYKYPLWMDNVNSPGEILRRGVCLCELTKLEHHIHVNGGHTTFTTLTSFFFNSVK